MPRANLVATRAHEERDGHPRALAENPAFGFHPDAGQATTQDADDEAEDDLTRAAPRGVGSAAQPSGGGSLVNARPVAGSNGTDSWAWTSRQPSS